MRDDRSDLVLTSLGLIFILAESKGVNVMEPGLLVENEKME